jgi:UDP-4-amino-4,6-dideoxy-N-acetyl-beta-L-altrosamine transaminase
MSDPRFLPYARQLVEDDDIAAVAEVLRGEFLTTGPRVRAFEDALADSVGAAWAVAVSSGTAALHAACFAAGVGPGDEVIVPAVTFAASANCARYLGAEPRFADVDPRTGLIVPESVAERIRPATRAIVAVHLAGACADIGALRGAAERVGAQVLEDAAHALGGGRATARVGSCTGGSRMAAFSFHPVKHVTTGEGGAVTGNDRGLERTLRLFRDHGIERDPGRLGHAAPGPWYYEQQLLGHNLRLSDIHAALGLSQLRKLARFVLRRRALAAAYDRRIGDLAGVEPVVGPGAREDCAYHLYAVRIDFAALGTSRADVMRALRERGIGTQVHYVPVPMHPYYRARGWDPGEFPGALAYYERTLSLPLFPAMRDDDVGRVVDALRSVLGGGG